MKELSLWKILFFALVVFPVAVFVFFVFIIPLVLVLLVCSLFWSGLFARSFRWVKTASGSWREEKAEEGDYVDVESTVVESTVTEEAPEEGPSVLPEGKE